MNPNTPNTGPNPGLNDTEITGNGKNTTNQNTQPQDSGNPTHSDGFTIIPPNISKRNKLLSMAQKEMDDLQRLKERPRSGPIQLPPERIGGTVSLSEVRERQQMAGHQAKLQKKLKQEDMSKQRKQAEEEEIQRMKDIQREKANKLEISKKQEEERRKELYQHDLLMKREAHLQKLEKSSSVPMVASSSKPTSSWTRGHEYRESGKAQEQVFLQQKKDEQRMKSLILEEKHQQEEEDRKSQLEKERVRVNSAFLDSLEAKGSGKTSELLPCTPKLVNVWQISEPQVPASSPVSFPSQLHTDSAEEEEEEEEKDADREWVVMKLKSMFSYYERDFLEDIVSQCNGNFQEAYDLLND